MLAGKYKTKPQHPPLRNTAPKPVLRNTDPRPPSLNPAQLNTPCAAKQPTQHYTGHNLLGIATMHKSNLVPIFNPQAAIDAAQMRR